MDKKNTIRTLNAGHLNETDSAPGKLTPATVVLMLAVVFLSLYKAGFDNQTVNWVILMLIIVAIGYTYQGNLSLDFNFTQPLFWFALFILWSAFSFFWSINSHRTLVEFIQLALFGIAFILAATLSENNIYRLGRITMVVGVLVALFGLSQYLLLDIIRIQSTFAYPNPFGIFLVMLILLGWGYYLRKPNRYLFLICVVLLVTLYLTYSRGSFICLAIALPVLFVGLDRSAIKKPLLKTVLCFLVSLLVTQGVVFIAPYLQAYMSEIISSSSVLLHVLTERGSFIAWSGISRFAYWEAAINIASNNPLNGTGLGTFFLAHHTVFADNVWYSRFTHNHYLQTLAELGIIGLSLLVGFILTILRLSWLKLKQGKYPLFYPGMIAALLAFLIHIGGDFSWNYPGVTLIFFLMAGAVVGLSKTENMPSNKTKNSGLIIVFLLLLLLSVWQLTAYNYYKRGIIFEAHQDYIAAAEAYDRANSFYPINSMAYSFAANSHYRIAVQQQNPLLLNNALIRAERAVDLSPVDSNLHNQLGRLYWELKRLGEAEHHLKMGVQNAGYRLPLYIDLAWFYIEQGRPEEAKTIIMRALELGDYAVGMHPTDEDWEKAEQQVAILEKMLEVALPAK